MTNGACPRCGGEHAPGACFSSIGDEGESSAEPGAASVSPEPAPAALRLIGRMVGEYQVTGLIGEGGMGTVYAGVQPLIGKKCAIKVLHANLSKDPELMERFLSEARAVNKIGHPNIIDVFSFGNFSDGSQYFVMEYLQGKSLSKFLENKKPCSYSDAYMILVQVLEALEAAHKHGIVHRDLKPDNIYLVDRPGVRRGRCCRA